MMNMDQNTNFKEMEDILFENLSVEDWLSIQHIRSAFLSAFQNDPKNFPLMDLSNPDTALISWSYRFHDISLRFIEFLRQLDEFEHLNADDRFILIKYNLLPIYPICRCFNIESIDEHSWYNGIQIADRTPGQLLMICGASANIHQSFVNMISALIRLSEQDSTLLILFMTILIFTPSLSMNHDEPFLNDPLAVHRAQLHYTTLLWNYSYM